MRQSDASGVARIHLSQRVPAIALVAKEHSAQRRLYDALVSSPSLRVRAVPSLRRLMAAQAADDVVVTYHEELGADDCDLFKRVKARFPGLAVVAVCETADGRAVRRALDTGIDGLVVADELERALLPTIAAALAGQIAVPRDLRTLVRKPSLSPSERKVLGLLVSGCTNSEISARLFLAESTVKSHLSSAYTKLGVRSRGEAVSLLLEPNGPLGSGSGSAAAASDRSDALAVAV